MGRTIGEDDWSLVERRGCVDFDSIVTDSPAEQPSAAGGWGEPGSGEKKSAAFRLVCIVTRLRHELKFFFINMGLFVLYEA